MAAPIFQREGARIGGVTGTTLAMVARTDSSGTRLFCDVYENPSYSGPVVSSAAATLSAANNYQATAYVTGLTAGKRYWWRARADDGANSTNGTVASYTAGSFKTVSTGNHKMVVIGCQPCNPFFDSVANQMASVVGRWKALNPDYAINSGDIYYSDIHTNNATANYTSGAWRNPATDADRTSAAYRTNFITAFDHLGRNGKINGLAEFYANTPTGYMWDDHDRCKNDCSSRATAAGDLLAAWNTGRDVGHECFMALNKTLIEQDGRSWTAKSTEESYFYWDIGSVRYIVIDGRTFRDLSSSVDSASKTMLGAVQKAWLKARILDNPKMFCCIVTPLMLDGNHGWSESTTDGYSSYSYERDEILDYIWDNGSPERTFFVGGDTHIGWVGRHHGASDAREVPIYEFCSGNGLWVPSPHGFVNGLKGGASGRGAIQEFVWENHAGGNNPSEQWSTCICLIDATESSCRVQLISTQSGKVLYQRSFI